MLAKSSVPSGKASEGAATQRIGSSAMRRFSTKPSVTSSLASTTSSRPLRSSSRRKGVMSQCSSTVTCGYRREKRDNRPGRQVWTTVSMAPTRRVPVTVSFTTTVWRICAARSSICSASGISPAPRWVSLTERLSRSNSLVPSSSSSVAIRPLIAACVVCICSAAALKLFSRATHRKASTKRRFMKRKSNQVR